MTDSPANSYSANWFRFFHFDIPAARTVRETDFICQCAPLPEYKRVLDLCCGAGRHARELALRGYSVIAVDRDEAAIRHARELGGKIEYRHLDIREFHPRTDSADVAIVMSQSFGYFDAETNGAVLKRLGTGLRKGGRIILDLWHREFFESRQGQHSFETAGGVVHETKSIHNGRLLVCLTYPTGETDRFDWQLFSPDEMKSLAASIGLRLCNRGTNFDDSVPSTSDPRIQFVLDRP